MTCMEQLLAESAELWAEHEVLMEENAQLKADIDKLLEWMRNNDLIKALSGK